MHLLVIAFDLIRVDLGCGCEDFNIPDNDLTFTITLLHKGLGSVSATMKFKVLLQ